MTPFAKATLYLVATAISLATSAEENAKATLLSIPIEPTKSSLSNLIQNSNLPDFAKKIPPLELEPSKAKTPVCWWEGKNTDLLKPNKHVYYADDELEIDIKLPLALKKCLTEADAYLLVHNPKGETVATPINLEDLNKPFFKMSTQIFPKGDYYLAVIFTHAAGNPFNINEWHNSFTSLINIMRIKITGKMSLDTDEEDMDGDGEIDGDKDGDGFADGTEP